MKSLVQVILLLLFVKGTFAQQNLLSLNTFYRDQLLANKGIQPLNNGSFFPINESEYPLMSLINDSSKQYYDFTEILFKKHLIEAKGKDYYITISPAIDITKGKDLNDTLERKLFQNTRGVHAEGDLFNNFSFSTSFYENQSRNTLYESQYYNALGELYPNGGKYKRQNAVIPGAGRTKSIEDGGFDYAYAIGYIVYRPFKQLSIRAGNNQQFIGDGYRSVLLSDNSSGAPYFRIDWAFHPKFRFTYHRARLLNLLRKPTSSSVESYYGPKGFAVNYFTYMPTEKINISLFEGTVWNKGDSIISKSCHPLYYNPIPGISGLALKDKNEVYTLLGVNAAWQIFDHHRIYTQFAFADYDFSDIAYQIGYRGYNFFGLNDLMLQVEYNYAAPNTYIAKNPRLSYSHFNLPMAHVKGAGFSELVIRANYEFKRIYASLSSNFITTKDHNDRSLLAIYDDLELSSENISYNSLELGYRFNRMMNLCVFGRFTYRTTTKENVEDAQLVEVGISTPLVNHYKDF